MAYDELQRHNTPSDCWLAIEGRVYNFTAFAEDHPGGAQLVTDHAGKVATAEFLATHGEGLSKITSTLTRPQLAAAFVGLLDEATVPKVAARRPSRWVPAWRSLLVWGVLPAVAVALAVLAATRVPAEALGMAALGLAVVAGGVVGVRTLLQPRAWVYGRVTAAIMDELSAATAADRVFWAQDPAAADQIKTHSAGNQ